MLVAVTKVVLAELAGHIVFRFQVTRNRWVLLFQAEIGAWQADLGQARAERDLPIDEGGAASRTRLLAVGIGEQHSIVNDSIDIGRLVTHHPLIVGADVPIADIVAPDDEDDGLLLRHHRSHGRYDKQAGCGDEDAKLSGASPNTFEPANDYEHVPPFF